MPATALFLTIMNFNFKTEIAKEIVWPSRCAICDKPGELVCHECMRNLPFIDACRSCPTCGGPNGQTICTECNDVMLSANQLQSFPLDELRHVVILNDEARKIITTYKDAGERRLASLIANLMLRYIEPQWFKEGCLITHIPPTESAKLKRGFDHMGEIENLIASKTGLRTIDMFESPNSVDQRNLTRKERFTNMQKVIKLRKGVSADFYARPILLIDDVCTTGATLYAAAKCLKSAGFDKVYALTFGKVQN